MTLRVLTKPMWVVRSNYELQFPKGTEFELTTHKDDTVSFCIKVKKLAEQRKRINSHFGYISIKKEFGIGENWFEGYNDTLYLSETADVAKIIEAFEKSVRK